ncbi:DUF6790 family protein [Francisella adeliensis]|uniref:Uncharacterized protein n=1 Tax=Francisella adeliensis TaxID=2007306 RepID=A0A2Z4XZP6_9GAMM|nr:DUF6790 family protein [Francisella adeliensis]AXA34244.1 hypothetical protein CDH04_07430 [Francisella adeliensis]MBK2084885.1 hypothetical protein [Francisella adeliensis]MBK2096284.1 hypothetical protein [Francisella adeliensis]QIW12488.1 hypothetical protein FZC43_07435 [Francisella adeliensis]QIW14361.1 hypothetical protein FZC44_07430 [Francisella adeliensis]
MVTIVISVCLLITPFIIAFLHSSIIYKKHFPNIYANYFIAINISVFMLLNSYAYLVDGDYMSKFQGWIYTPAVFQLGLYQLSLFILSIVALFKGSAFKAACLLFFSIYTILNILSLFSGAYNEIANAVMIVDILTAVISFGLYKALSRKA